MKEDIHKIIIRLLNAITPLGTLIALDTPQLNIVYNIGIVLLINIIIVFSCIFQISIIEKITIIIKKKYFSFVILTILCILFVVPTLIQEIAFKHNIHHYLSCTIAILVAFYCIKSVIRLEKLLRFSKKITRNEISIIYDYICLFIQFCFIQVISRYKMYPHKNFNRNALIMLQIAMIITYIIIGLSLWYIIYAISNQLMLKKWKTISQIYPIHLIFFITTYFFSKGIMAYYYTNNPIEDDYYIAGNIFSILILMFGIYCFIKEKKLQIKSKNIFIIVLSCSLFIYIHMISNIEKKKQNFNYSFSDQNINYIVNIFSLIVLFIIPTVNILLEYILCKYKRSFDIEEK